MKQLKRYEITRECERKDCPKQVITWYPIGRKKRKSRSKSTWMNGIPGMMGEMGHIEED